MSFKRIDMDLFDNITENLKNKNLDTIQPTSTEKVVNSVLIGIDDEMKRLGIGEQYRRLITNFIKINFNHYIETIKALEIKAGELEKEYNLGEKLDWAKEKLKENYELYNKSQQEQENESRRRIREKIYNTLKENIGNKVGKLKEVAEIVTDEMVKGYRKLNEKSKKELHDYIKRSFTEKDTINFNVSPDGFGREQDLINELRKTRYPQPGLVSINDIVENVVPDFSNVLNVLPRTLINLNYDRDLMVRFYENFTFPAIMKIIEISSEEKSRIRILGIETQRSDEDITKEKEKIKNSLINLISTISPTSKPEIISIVNDLFSSNREKINSGRERLLRILTEGEESLSEFNMSILRILGRNPVLVRRLIEGNIKNLESFSRQIDEIEEYLIKEYSKTQEPISLSNAGKLREVGVGERFTGRQTEEQREYGIYNEKEEYTKKKENLFDKLKNFLSSEDVPVLAKLSVIAGGGMMLFGLLDFGMRMLFSGGTVGGVQYLQPAQQQQQFPLGSLIMSVIGGLLAWLGFSSYKK